MTASARVCFVGYTEYILWTRVPNLVIIVPRYIPKYPGITQYTRVYTQIPGYIPNYPGIYPNTREHTQTPGYIPRYPDMYPNIRVHTQTPGYTPLLNISLHFLYIYVVQNKKIRWRHRAVPRQKPAVSRAVPAVRRHRVGAGDDGRPQAHPQHAGSEGDARRGSDGGRQAGGADGRARGLRGAVSPSVGVPTPAGE